MEINLLHFPDELLGEILSKLDLESRLAVWETCTRLRRALKQPSVMARSSLTRADTMLSRALHDLAPHVYELDLSGVPALTANQATSAMPYFVNIRAIDVTGTQLSMWDAGAICNLRPSITRLATPFTWPLYKHLSDAKLKKFEKALKVCQQSFRHLRDIRFVAESEEINGCGAPLLVLQLATEIRSLHIDILKETKATEIWYYQLIDPVLLPPSLRVFSVNNENFDSIQDDYCRLPGALLRHFDDWQSIALKPKLHGSKLYMTERIWRHLQTDIDKCCLQMDWSKARLYPQHLMWHEDLEKLNHQMYDDIAKKIVNVVTQNTYQYDNTYPVDFILNENTKITKLFESIKFYLN